MKQIIIKNICILATASLLLSACTKNFATLNTPPSSAATLDPGQLISYVQKNANYIQGGEGANIQFGSWVQHWAGGVVAKTSRYIQEPDNGTWSTHYALIRNLAQIRNKLLKGQEGVASGRSKIAIAEIMELVIWERLTALYGDIPYSQSGLSETAIITQPVYDSQQSIYEDIIKKLDAATAQITDGDAGYGAADFYFKGDFSKWRKYANSVKLQIGMRLKKANPTLAEKTVREALAANLMASAADNATVPTFTDLPANYNPLLLQFSAGSPDLAYLASAFVNFLKNNKDPRLTLIVAPTANSVKAGAPAYNGIDVALTDNQSSGLNKADYSTASLTTYFNKTITSPIPVYVMTYADVCYLKAEAALLGWGPTIAQAQGFFQDGVKASLAMAPYNITTVPATFASQLILTGSTDAQLEQIMNQRWISLFGREYDAYLEWRRTGYPKLIPGQNKGTTNGTIPRRTAYPSDESILNKDNYLKASQLLNHGDDYTSNIWLDK